MSLTDRIAQGLAAGWKVTDAATLTTDQTHEADVVVIGTGAGGGTTAEILARAGLSVILVEEGRLYYQKDFRMDELTAYAALYQEGMSRVTRDGAIAILQGRCVGGSTTVNWTSSFRTPDATLNHWADRFGLDDLRPEAMTPWFAGREQRHNIAPWAADPNVNNDILRQGCEQLGYSWAVIPRNVKGCWNLGYCGVGCPTNAKQGALTTTIPGALDHEARLFHGLRAERLVMRQDRVDHLIASALAADGVTPSGVSVTLRARHFVVAASAIGSPGLLLRSDIPDPYQRLGKRTFLHPVNGTVAQMPQQTDPFTAPPSRSTPTTSISAAVSLVRSASNWKCRPCTRQWRPASCRATARISATPSASCPGCSLLLPCFGMAFTRTVRAAPSACGMTAARSWTTRLPTICGKVCDGHSGPWRRSSLPPAPSGSG